MKFPVHIRRLRHRISKKQAILKIGANLKLSRLGDGNGLLGAVVPAGLGVLDPGDNIHALDNLAKHDVATIQPVGLDGCDEELGSVGILACVGHGNDSGAGVVEVEVLVLELFTVNRSASSSIATSKVTSLNHELLDDTMEGRALVTIAMGTLGELKEVLGGPGDILSEKTDDDASNILVALLHIKVDLVGDDRAGLD